MARKRYARTYKRPIPGSMNKGEQKYAEYLQFLQSNGEIMSFGFEAIKLRIGPRCTYTPDFLVEHCDGHLELHEVKGRKGKTYWAEEDAKVKLKAVAEKYPFKVIVVWPDLVRNGGGWCSQVI